MATVPHDRHSTAPHSNTERSASQCKRAGTWFRPYLRAHPRLFCWLRCSALRYIATCKVPWIWIQHYSVHHRSIGKVATRYGPSRHGCVLCLRRWVRACVRDTRSCTFPRIAYPGDLTQPNPNPNPQPGANSSPINPQLGDETRPRDRNETKSLSASRGTHALSRVRRQKV